MQHSLIITPRLHFHKHFSQQWREMTVSDLSSLLWELRKRLHPDVEDGSPRNPSPRPAAGTPQAHMPQAGSLPHVYERVHVCACVQHQCECVGVLFVCVWACLCVHLSVPGWASSTRHIIGVLVIPWQDLCSDYICQRVQVQTKGKRPQ